MESTISWHRYRQNHFLLESVYTFLGIQINKTYDQRNINKYTEVLLVTANEQFIRSCSQAHVHHIVYNTHLFASSLQVIRISVETVKTVLHLEACIWPSETTYKREERSNITKQTGLLL